MESNVIETLGCPLGADLSKSWKQSSLESSHSHTSDISESSDEETETKNDDLIEQLKNLSFGDISDSKHIISKSNKISEASSPKKDDPEELEFKNKEIDGNKSSSIKNKGFLKFVVDIDAESTICNCSNKNCGMNSKKKNNPEKFNFVEDLENVENELASLSLKNDNFLKKCHKSDSGISTGDVSDSDDDEQVESVILRERDPTRHNRTENNKQHRVTPFSRNHKQISISHFNSNNFQTFRNFSPHISHDLNTSCGFYSPINPDNGTDPEIYGIVSPSGQTFHATFPTLDTVTSGTFEGMASSFEIDQIFNNAIPCTGNNQTVNEIVPCTVTDQIVDGLVPYTVDAVLDNAILYTDDNGNSNDKFSKTINDTPCFGIMKESIFSGYAATDVEKEPVLDFLEHLTLEELENIRKTLADSTLNSVHNQNHVDFIEGSSSPFLSSKEDELFLNNSTIFDPTTGTATTVEEINYPNNYQRNLYPEPNQEHYSFSKENIEETSFSNLCDENYIMEKSGQYYNSENFVNKLDNYSNLVCKNVTSINCESLSPQMSDYRIISNEIEHEIVKWKEIKKRVNKGQKNLPEGPCEINWNVFPFNELDDNAILSINTSENKLTNAKNDSRKKNINQTSKSPPKCEKIRIRWMLGTTARDKLFNSPSFCETNWRRENEYIRQEIISGKLGTEQKKVIHVLKKDRNTKYRGTNLHLAILSENIEKVFCIVEWHKECHDDINEINIRDSFKKTVLDYSKEKGMDLLTDYLEENTAKVSINIK